MKFLTFKIAAKTFALPIEVVSEVTGDININPIPNATHDILGIMNIKGKIVSVIDMARVFEMSNVVPINLKSGVIILKIAEEMVGILVEEIGDVINIKEAEISPLKNVDHDLVHELMSGVYKSGYNSFIVLLDMKKLSEHKGFRHLNG